MAELNYHHLRAFRAVASEGHLTRAAQRLHVSQSAVSAQIRTLEARLEQPLFERTGRRLELTEFGRIVLGYAESIFSLGDELLATASAGARTGIQRLRVGNIATLSRNFQENFLRPVLGDRDIRLTLESGSLNELLDRLAVHRLDIVLSNQPVSGGGDRPWQCRQIAAQPVCLVGPPGMAPTPFRFPPDLDRVQLLLPGPGSDIRTQFDLICQSHEITPQVLAEVDDMAMLRLLTRDSGGVGLIPPVVVQDELRSGDLQALCVLPDVRETFYAITAERRFQPPVLTRLLNTDHAVAAP